MPSVSYGVTRHAIFRSIKLEVHGSYQCNQPGHDRRLLCPLPLTSCIHKPVKAMRTEDLLEQCLQALISGHNLPPDLARYLTEHPEQRAEVEELLFIAQRVSQLPPAELSPAARHNMQARLAARLGLDPDALNAPRTPTSAPANSTGQPDDLDTGLRQQASHRPPTHKKPLFSVGGLSLARLRYEPPPAPPEDAEARIREVFRDLTPEDIRRYIGVRGESYLYYRQRFPGWEPIFMMLAMVLRGFKQIEKLMTAG